MFRHYHPKIVADCFQIGVLRCNCGSNKEYMRSLFKYVHCGWHSGALSSTAERRPYNARPGRPSTPSMLTDRRHTVPHSPHSTAHSWRSRPNRRAERRPARWAWLQVWPPAWRRRSAQQTRPPGRPGREQQSVCGGEGIGCNRLQYAAAYISLVYSQS